jgi:hypothetical protein
LTDEGRAFRECGEIEEGGEKVLNEAIRGGSKGASPLLPRGGALIEREVVEDVR